MSQDKRISRRALLQTALVVAPVAVTGCATTAVESDEKPLVRVDDPVARSMAYFPDTRDVPADHPLAANHDVSQKCVNCLHRRESVDADRIVCPTFPGRLVNTNGWCSLWAKG